MAAATRPLLVIGIGNADRGDDVAGLLVARWLGSRPAPGVEIVEHGGEAAALVGLLARTDHVVMIDACVSGAAAGTVRRFDVVAAALPEHAFEMSTHGLGLAQAVELARALGQLPQRAVVYAIEGSSFEPGARPSPAVVAAVAEVGRLVRLEIGQLHATETGGAGRA